jgi:serine/threonine protein kinase
LRIKTGFSAGTAVGTSSLFAVALEKATPADLSAFMDETCAGDAAMRRRVEALVWSHENAQLLNGPAVELGGVAPGAATVAATDLTARTACDFLLDFLAPSDKPGSLGRLDHYEVDEVIGHGGIGVVLQAFDERLHRVVAIKVIAAQLATSAIARRRFTREAQAAAAVSHDHIVTIHAVEEADGLPYLVMQYVDGMSLQDRLDGDGPLRLAEILRIGVQTAAGLAAAHAQGLVHRDIKPANILLENGVERVKITDFGLARAVDDASFVQSGVVAGTPQYMSPEQAEGKAVDVRTDLFSLGSVLYAMCTGRAPFRASGAFVVLGGEGVAQRKFDTRAEAVVGSSEGDTIEIRGDGPFVIPHTEIKHALTVRAGSGFRPVITDQPQEYARGEGRILMALAPLRLEGLDIRGSSKIQRVLFAIKPLAVANCRFLMRMPASDCIASSAGCVVRNCELTSILGAALEFEPNAGADFIVTNNLLVGHNNLEDRDVTRGAAFRFTHNTFVTTGMATALQHIPGRRQEGGRFCPV